MGSDWKPLVSIYSCVCPVGEFLRILPWDLSPFCTTIWENMFCCFSKHLKQTQVEDSQENGRLFKKQLLQDGLKPCFFRD